MEGEKYLKAFSNLNCNQQVALTFHPGTKSELRQLLANLQKVVYIHNVWVYKGPNTAAPKSVIPSDS